MPAVAERKFVTALAVASSMGFADVEIMAHDTPAARFEGARFVPNWTGIELVNAEDIVFPPTSFGNMTLTHIRVRISGMLDWHLCRLTTTVHVTPLDAIKVVANTLVLRPNATA